MTVPPRKKLSARLTTDTPKPLDLQDGAGCDGGDGPLRGKSGESEHNGAVMPMGRRSSSVWTQQGPKLVGTDAVGQAEQGNSVSHSAESWVDLATAGP